MDARSFGTQRENHLLQTSIVNFCNIQVLIIVKARHFLSCLLLCQSEKYYFAKKLSNVKMRNSNIFYFIPQILSRLPASISRCVIVDLEVGTTNGSLDLVHLLIETIGTPLTILKTAASEMVTICCLVRQTINMDGFQTLFLRQDDTSFAMTTEVTLHLEQLTFLVCMAIEYSIGFTIFYYCTGL